MISTFMLDIHNNEQNPKSSLLLTGEVDAFYRDRIVYIECVYRIFFYLPILYIECVYRIFVSLPFSLSVSFSLVLLCYCIYA